jgi:ABC-type ATPase with predicted acetyltransferase domain
MHITTPGMGNCCVSRCGKPTRGYSKYCGKHALHDQRHGHPEQRPVLKQDLRSTIDHLEKWARHPEAASTLASIVDHYREAAEALAKADLQLRLEEDRRGIIHNTTDRRVIRTVAHVLESKDPRVTVLELLALGVMYEEQPHVFKSHTSFKSEAVITFLRNSGAFRKKTYRPASGKVTAATRYLPRNLTAATGEWLIDTVIVYGFKLSRMWNDDARRKQEAKERLTTAIRETALGGP